MASVLLRQQRMQLGFGRFGPATPCSRFRTPSANGVAYDPDGKVLATADGLTIKLWEASTGKPVRTLTGHGQTSTVWPSSADGKLLASAAGDWHPHRQAQPGELKVWDPATGVVKVRISDGTPAGSAPACD